MRVLIACEESQSVCKAFRSLGHEAYSCDTQGCSGGHPEWHIQGDAIEAAYGQDWDMMIAHPPCTYLAVSGARWMYHPDDKELPFEDRRPHPKHPHRRQQQAEAMEFVMKLSSAPIPRIAIENPISVISSRWRKPDQIIQPWQFGHEATKSTCLWLKGLPLLSPTDIVSKGERVVFKSGKSHPAWYAEAFNKARTREDRSKMRSKTFEGIANAMAEQWGNL